MAEFTKTYPPSQRPVDPTRTGAYSPPMFYDGANILWDSRSLRAAGVVFGEVRYRAGGFCGPRVQRDFQLVMLHSGSARVTVGGATRELRTGWAALFRPGGREHFRFSPDGETHHTWCAIASRHAPADLRRILAVAPAEAPCSETFRHLHAAAFKLNRPLHESTRGVIQQLGLCLFREYVNMARPCETDACRMAPVNRALRYMEEHFGDEDCLAAAHAAAGLSRNALIYKFRAELKRTPARHLWNLRVERGVGLLGETGLTVSEIAYRCGFKNPFHFSRRVRARHGAPPREIRRAAWTGGDAAAERADRPKG